MIKAEASAKQGEIGFSHMSGGSWVRVRERCNVPQHTWPHHFHFREKDAAERVGCAYVACAESGGVVRQSEWCAILVQEFFRRKGGQGGVDDLDASSGGHMMFDSAMRKWDTAIAVQLVARSAALDSLDRTLNLGRSES